MGGKRGQLTVFIVIALVILAAVIFYFLFRSTLTETRIPASLEPAYTSFLSCLEENALTGISLLESQAGYIYLPDYEQGSQYMPFGSQLNFLGNPIPYWYYISGNNIPREQIPNKKEMEEQLSTFINERIRNCNFENYYQQGFVVSMGEPNADVSITDNAVVVNLDMEMTIERGNDTAIVRSHEKTIDSPLGSMYNSALKIYDYEKQSLFLENYSIDVLRSYAPVDGVEISCSPKIWNADQVFDELQEAIEINTLALKSQFSDYTLKNKENEYFVVGLPVEEDVRFLTSRNWPSNFEVNPSEGNVLVATPIGNQPGLGILGFCYVPYHFVYNVKYPVMVQIYRGEEIFQFPVAVIIEGNSARQSKDVDESYLSVSEFCQYKNIPVEVNVYGSGFNPVDAEISYKCFGEMCPIGKTSSGKLNADFPQCANGYIVARTQGYEEGNYQLSTTSPGKADIVLDKLYGFDVELNVDGKNYNGDALISFVSQDGQSSTIAYPEQKKVELSQGQYEIQVYIYKNSSIELQESTTKKCLDIPESGLGGFIGLTREKCFDIVVPAQIISNALAGGGKQSYYLLENDLKGKSTIKINTESLPVPTSIQQLQDNYNLFESNRVEIEFK